MNRGDFQKLAEMRLDDAKALLDQGKWAGAYYLAGYAVECALKACVAKLTNQYDFPDKQLANKCYTHDLDELAKRLDKSTDASVVNGIRDVHQRYRTVAVR